jgi:thioredoxin reductase (NADPH)
MKIKIFGKENCPYCDFAKQLLDRVGEEYEYENASSPETVSMIKETYGDSISTVPVVIVDGIYIGGYDQLKEHINKNYAMVNGEYRKVLYE